MNQSSIEKIKISPLNRILIFILFLLIVSIPPIFYSAQGVTDPFLFRHIAFVQKFLHAVHFPLKDVVFSPTYIPGTIATLITLSKISGIPPKTLQFLPIIGIILPIAYYTLCKKVSNSTILACIVTIIMMYGVSPITFFTVWVHAWAFLLFLIFILIYFELFKKRDIKRIILLLIVFISIHFSSYSVEMWAVSFSIIMNLLLVGIIFISKSEQIKSKLTFNLSLAFLTIFLAFNKVIYDSYLSKGRFIDTLSCGIQFFFHKYESFLPWAKASSPEKYTYVIHHSIPPLLDLFYLILIISPILLSILASLNKLLKDKQLVTFMGNLKEDTYFKFTLLLVGVIDIAIYSIRGVITFRYIHFIFPLLTLISLRQLSFKKSFKTGILLILLVIVIFHTGLSWHYGEIISNPSKYADLEPSADWFLNKSVQKEALIDLRTGDKYLLEATSKNMYFERHYIDSHKYEMIVDSKYSLNKNEYLHRISDYIIINKNLRWIMCIDWKQYEPFYKYLPEINNNVNINKIYDDNKIWIFKT